MLLAFFVWLQKEEFVSCNLLEKIEEPKVPKDGGVLPKAKISKSRLTQGIPQDKEWLATGVVYAQGIDNNVSSTEESDDGFDDIADGLLNGNY